MKRAAAALVCAAMVLAGVVVAGASGVGGASPHLSGSIRYAPTGWAPIENAAHAPLGMSSVTTLPDRVRVWYSEPIDTVGSLQATVDESFAAAGVRVGASVGLRYVDLFFYMGASPTPVDPSLLTRAGANVWLTAWPGVTP